MRKFSASVLASSSAALGAALVVFASSAYAAPKPETGWGLPHDASQYGHHVDWLIHITNIFVGILFVIMCVWMLIAVFRHGEKHEAEHDHGTGKKHVMTALALSGVIFFVVDGNLYVNAMKDIGTYWGFEKIEPDPKTVKIEVNAHQWAWDFRYPGPDGRFNTADDILSLNELQVPVGRPIVMQMASPDVIHSLYLPNFRIKQDVTPGMVNRMWFQAKETGEFDIACAQHCGAHHYKMKGLLRVLPNESFEQWQKEASAIAERGFDTNDSTAHWGWEWKPL